MGEDLSTWTSREGPHRAAMDGRYVRLEPLDAARHGDQLFEASSGEGAQDRFRYLYEEAPASRQALEPWLERAAASDDPMWFAVIDKASGKVAGRQTLMRIDAANGAAEIGICGARSCRVVRPTEALYLFARHV